MNHVMENLIALILIEIIFFQIYINVFMYIRKTIVVTTGEVRL